MPKLRKNDTQNDSFTTHTKKRLPKTEEKLAEHAPYTCINMGRGTKGVVEQSSKKQKPWEQLPSADRCTVVGRLSVKPTYVDVPNDIVDAIKANGSTRYCQYPSLERNVNKQIRGCLLEHEAKMPHD